MYTLQPQDGYDFAALRSLDKPVLITEFNFGSADRGPFWGGVTQLAKEEDRGPAYANFLKQAMSEPSIVGVHWFQYLDQPVTGRLLDGENGHLRAEKIEIVLAPEENSLSRLDATDKVTAETLKIEVQFTILH